MKKVGFLFVGTIFGLALGLTASVYASSGLVGKKIQQEVNVVKDGQLIGTAIIVDGRSYAPVRAIGEAAGYSVSYTKEQITLTAPQQNEETTTDKPADEPANEETTNDKEENPSQSDDSTEPNQGNAEDNLLNEKKLKRSEIFWQMSNLSADIYLKRVNKAPQEEIDAMVQQYNELKAQYDALSAEIEALQNQ